MQFRIMVVELHIRPFTVVAENSQEAIEKVKTMTQTTEELPESIPIDILNPAIWPVVKVSYLIIPEDTKIIRPDFGDNEKKDLTN